MYKFDKLLKVLVLLELVTTDKSSDFYKNYNETLYFFFYMRFTPI